MLFEKAAVIGVGLIGGSFGLALKAAGACRKVVGIGRSAQNLKNALACGAIDAIATDISDCDLVLIATPVAQFASVFQGMRIHEKALVTDGGSTKRDVIAAARRALGANVRRFVPAHPIAGSEKSGAAAARADLFRGRRVILTPLPENEEASIRKIRQAWEACGATVSTMDPKEHDSVLSTVSHLPHLLAFAMVDLIAGAPDARRLFGFAAGGFRDFTRIAGSSPEMWRDICATNREAILAGLDAYQQELEAMYALIEQGDLDALTALFERARAARTRWVAAK